MTPRWKCRCAVLSSGYSRGSQFHWQPIRNRKITASRTARWSVRAGPFRAGGSCFARIGSINVHCSSDIRQIEGSGSRTFFGRPMAHLPPGEGRRVPTYLR